VSLPLLEQFEAQRASTQKRQSEERLMRANGHNQTEIDQALAGGTHANPTAGAATASEREHPNYTPGQTLLGGGVTPGTKKADEEAGSESLLGKATKLLSPATEASEKAGEKLGEAEKAEVKLPEVKLPNPLSWTEAIAKVFSKLTEGSFWVRVLKFILGAGLIVVAIFFFARAAGLGAETPVTAATQEASRAIAGGAHNRQTRVSTGTRQRVQQGVERETQRDDTERSKTGKPLAGGALTARQKARVRQRDEQLPSVRELRKASKRR